ncbi:MAG TPA: transposase [Candidatus Binataceae bacterium]|nr:transposase [Candidatus Binataceae bacterium]
MLAHPHIHCLSPAGGIAFDQSRWIRCRNPRFFLPGKVLGAKFRGKFLALLRRAFRRGKLQLGGTLAPLQERKAFDRFTWSLKNKDWVVYAKKPFAAPRHVIQYLAHYTHRVAIANGRLLRFENGQVTFRWRDSAHRNQKKIMTLDAVEFMRRFLLHVLPRGFVKIRHFGFLANRERKRALALCSALLPSTPPAIENPRAEIPSPPHRVRLCPHCPGTLALIARLTAPQLLARHLTPALDTS